MTDAALPITQSAVEQFTRRHLESQGCSIEVVDDVWMVDVPANATIPSKGEVLKLVCGFDDSELESSVEQLHAESAFFQQLLEDASTQEPIGTMAVKAEDEELRIPAWISENVDVIDASFSPYYDRIAVTLLFQISIETVSEYQTEILRAVTIDTQSKESLPELTRTYLESTTLGRDRLTKASGDQLSRKVVSVLDSAKQSVHESVQPEIDSVHEKASRAADNELEEYRRLREQHLNELSEEMESLVGRISELEESVSQLDDQKDRTEVLRERKELRTRKQELDKKVAKIRRRRERGFPEKQREIRDRHALKVRIKSVGATVIQYERGELALTLSDGFESALLRIGYGSGVGVTESVSCDRCENEFSMQNPLRTISTGIACHECTR